jgi:hypothetical protein
MAVPVETREPTTTRIDARNRGLFVIKLLFATETHFHERSDSVSN